MFSYIYMKVLELSPHSYDTGINLLSLGQAGKTLDIIVSSFIEKDMNVLDIGCGTGSLAVKAACKGAKVTGMDISQDMLAVAQRKVEAEGLDSDIELMNMGVLEMDEHSQDRSFDCVVSTLVLSELSPDERAFALRECHRILRDDGLLVIADETLPAGTVERIIYNLVRTPLALAAYAAARTGTSAIPDLSGLLACSGFKVTESRRSLLGSFTIAAARKDQPARSPRAVKEIPSPLWRKVLEPVAEGLFRWFPFPVQPGLRRIGEPGRNGPVLVTCNYSLSGKRLRKGLGDLDCFLLVADTGGINCWCSSAEGTFDARAVYSAVKASRVEDLVDHRELVLPQLCAPGVSRREVEELTGWRARFGPVFADDLPEYLRDGCRKTPAMHLYQFKPEIRWDLAISMNFVNFLIVMIALAVMRRKKMGRLALIFWSLATSDYLLFDRLPTRYGWTKALANGAFFSAAIGVINRISGGKLGDTRYYVLTCMGLSAMLGMDLAGITGVLKDEPLLLMYRLGIKRLGPFTVHPMELPSLDREKCTGCGNCYDVCPRGVYVMDEAAGKSMMINLGACEMCKACVKQCPQGAITI